MESAHWQSGIERRSTATPGRILVEIHSRRMDASREVIEDGESMHCKVKKIFAHDVCPFRL